MKKLLLIALVCLAGARMFAATNPTPWTLNTQGCESQSCNIYFKFYLNGQYVEDPRNFYVVAFDQDDICRVNPANAGAKWVGGNFNYYYYALTCKGYSGCEYHFRVWDTEQNCERTDLVLEFDFTPYEYESFTWIAQGKYGAATAPLTFDFTTPSAGIGKEIAAWTVEATGEVDQSNGWYLLATPVGTVAPAQVENMTSNEYDLYRFDQAASDGLEWINLKESNESLVPGKGYLYANSGGGQDTITITFPGDAYTEAVTVDLTNEDGFGLAGWNLVGNPWNANAYVTGSFYVMNESRTELATPNRTYLEPMEGAFFHTESDTQLTFSANPPADPEATLALNVSRDSKVVDRAVVSFGQERTLPKFQLNPSHTKVYIPQDNRDYAVVTAGEMGEMPVGFKAERNGSYTLDFTAQEVSFAYLHLIDNKTGKDVDLLESPAYSFDAQTTDYASRFKLVFATGNATEDNFAFCSNGNWIISNEGEATLQVVDVTGRILSSETVSGCVSKSISAAPGVYMLRLINGDNMKVQKVVVK